MEDQIIIQLPVRIGFEALRDYFRRELVGEVIKKQDKDGGETAYAEVLALSFEKSPEPDYELALHLNLKTLHPLYKNKSLQVTLLVTPEFLREEQRIRVKDYSLRGRNNSWLTNKFVQLLANTIMYGNLKSKLDFELLPLINRQLEKVNGTLMKEPEVYNGILVSGKLRQFEVTNVLVAQNDLVISVRLDGKARINIKKLAF